MEKFVNKVLATLSTSFDSSDLSKIKDVLFIALKDYDLTPKSTEISVYQDELPDEAKYYLVSRKIEGLADSSLEQYKRTLTLFFNRVSKRVQDIKTEDIRIYLYEAQKVHNMSNRSLDNQRIYINAFFQWCALNDYIPKNPAGLIKPFKYERKIKESLTTMELEQLRLACKTSQEKAVVEVLYSTGCRVQELVDLKLEDVDLTSREIKIRHGKGNKERIVYLNPKAILAIQEYVEGRDYPSVYLFENFRKPHGKLTTETIEHVCSRLSSRTGIYVHPHKIRRTTATHLYEKGMPIEKIQIILGHEDINTTEIYVSIDKESVKQDHKRYL